MTPIEETISSAMAAPRAGARRDTHAPSCVVGVIDPKSPAARAGCAPATSSSASTVPVRTGARPESLGKLRGAGLV